MALRSLVRKMPALGARSPAMGRPVHALSPATGFRFMSQGGTGGPVVYSDDDEAKHREVIKRMTAEFDKNIKEIHENLDAMEEAESQNSDLMFIKQTTLVFQTQNRKKLNKIETACDVALIVLVPTTVLLLMSL
ncbi:hypothetical protein ZWY2020_028221 [Hordeum vulgare]|nr:hypothetical protein ZWY2020_028221 [Hordeum vulgare]